jgi:very-short-patch-repair endonuclease
MRRAERVQRTSASELATIAFAQLLLEHRVPVPVPEYRFAPPRRWRFDFCWPESKVALEVDGGIWNRGRHTRGKGWLADSEKLNTAAVMGWRMLRCTPDQLASVEMIQTIKKALKQSEAA